MREIAEILVERGSLTATEILPELRGATLRGGALHEEPLTLGTLKKKMDVRIAFGRYFKSRGEGCYARRAGRGQDARTAPPLPAQAERRRVLSATSSR